MLSTMIKYFFLSVLFALYVSNSFSQEIATLNHGGTNQRNYYTEVQYEKVEELIVVKVSIAGKPYRFLLDTGAPNIITKKLYDELNPPSGKSNSIKKLAIWDASEKVDSLRLFALSGVTIGDIVFNDIPTLMANDQFLFDCLKIDGMIGSNMLRNSVLRISPKNQTVTITDQPERLNLAGKNFTEIYLNPQQSSPFVMVNLKGNGEVTLPVLFDTGAMEFISLALSDYKKLEAYNLFSVLAKTKGSSGIAAHGAESDTTKHRIGIPITTVGGTIFKNLIAQTAADGDSRLGSYILKYGVATLDYMNKKFYFDPFQNEYDLMERVFPVSFTLKNDKAVVGVIWDEELRGKIQLGDEVLSIDSIDLKKYTACDLMLILAKSKAKTQLTLKIKGQNGKITTLVINKK
ncbi:MAG: hypothetical protein EOO42_16120 [Flavobacteriales bacterium]|nr:MAG: hypothetical protein EOO42_16120 [Flavobacteriales bacterium]